MDLQQVRRVVTAYNAEGLAVFAQDNLVEKVSPPAGSSKTKFSPIWGTTTFPSKLELVGGRDGADDLGKPIVNTGGSTFRIVDTPAGGSSPFHRTESIDYIVVLQGEIILELENNEQTVLKTGDVAIQQGTLHRWTNDTQSTCRFACVALAAQPVEVPDATLAGPTFP